MNWSSVASRLKRLEADQPAPAAGSLLWSMFLSASEPSKEELSAWDSAWQSSREHRRLSCTDDLAAAVLQGERRRLNLPPLTILELEALDDSTGVIEAALALAAVPDPDPTSDGAGGCDDC